VNISDFRNVAGPGNGRVYLDSNTDELKVRRQTFLNRAVDWVRGRFSRNLLHATERDAVHNRFLRAIAGHAGYDRGDISHAEALLSADAINRKPLSARRIREVLDDLDSRSSQTTRDNRITAASMSGPVVDERLRARGAAVDESDRQRLAGRVEQAISALGGYGRRIVGSDEAATVTSRLVTDFLAERTVRAEPPPSAAPATGQSTAQATGQSTAQAPAGEDGGVRPTTTSGAAPVPDTVSVAAPTTAPSAAPAETAPTPSPAVERTPARPKDLLRLLGTAKLPGSVKAEVRKLVKSGAVTDRSSLAAHANQRTAEWVHENRIGRWYAQAQKHRGVGDRVRDGEMLMAPKPMLDAVARSITGSEDIVAYPAVKDRARALIAQYVSNEIGQQRP